MLIESSEKSWISKIKNFFKKIFSKKEEIKLLSQNNNETKNDIDRKSTFLKSIKNIEDEETKMLNLQSRYQCGEISIKNIEIDQIKSLWDLYNKQILNLKKSNELKRQEIMKHRKKLQES